MATSKDFNLTKKEEELIKLYRQEKTDLINFLLKNVMFAATPDELWKIVQGGVEVNGVVIASQDFRPFAKQAEDFIESPLWKQSKKMLELSAMNRGIRKATSIEEFTFSKAMLYNIDMIEEFFKKISKL